MTTRVVVYYPITSWVFRLIERLAERGMSHYPVMVEQAHTDQQIEDAGHRFVEQAFAPLLH